MKIKSSMYVCVSLVGALFSGYASEENQKECAGKPIIRYSGDEYNSAKAVRRKNDDKKASLEELFPFEIEYKGKSNNSIRVDIDNDNCRIVHSYLLGKGETSQVTKFLRLPRENIDTDKEIVISIRQNVAPDEIRPNYDQIYTINADGKTVYLKWEDGKLQPRVGSTFGSKTPSGLSVKNNVSTADIHQEKAVKPKAPASNLKLKTKKELEQMDDSTLLDYYIKYYKALLNPHQAPLSVINPKKTSLSVLEKNVFKNTLKIIANIFNERSITNQSVLREIELENVSDIDRMNVDQLKEEYNKYFKQMMRGNIQKFYKFQVILLRIKNLIEKKTGKEFNPEINQQMSEGMKDYLII